jgi:hypothetical protein
MINIRRSQDRGRVEQGWLTSRPTFSFGAYSDPTHMGFRSLRVLNEDLIGPGKGFGAHGHRDMEIFTYVLEGGLAHRDSTGENHVLRPNMVQAMSAGNGVIHSEFNASQTEPVHLLQIWILPDKEDVPPRYRQFAYDPAEKQGRLRLLVGPEPDPSEPAACIHQDARAYASVLAPGQKVEHPIAEGRHAWVQIARGDLTLNGQELNEGDGAAVSGERLLQLEGAGPDGAELLLMDLA